FINSIETKTSKKVNYITFYLPIFTDYVPSKIPILDISEVASKINVITPLENLFIAVAEVKAEGDPNSESSFEFVLGQIISGDPYYGEPTTYKKIDTTTICPGGTIFIITKDYKALCQDPNYIPPEPEPEEEEKELPCSNIKYCSKCSEEDETKCIECSDNRVLKNNKCILLTCPDEEKPYLDKDTEKCIEKCPHPVGNDDEGYPIDDYGNRISAYFYYKECLQQCPSGTDTSVSYDSKGNKIYNCTSQLHLEEVSSSNTQCNSDVIEYKSINDAEYIFNNLNTTISASISVKGDNDVLLISNYNYQLLLYDPKKLNVLEENSLSRVDISECVDSLVSDSEISSDESIYISQLEYNDGKTPVNTTMIKLTDKKGNNINTSSCKGSKVKVYKQINRKLTDIDPEIIKMLIEMGVDPFNPNDPFYTDYCISFSFAGKDTTLSVRQDNFLAHDDYCGKGCTLERIDAITNEAVCNCNFEDVEEKQEFNSMVSVSDIKYLVDNFFGGSNIKYSLCYKQAAPKEAFKMRYGMSIFVPFIIGQVGLALGYYFIAMNKILVKINEIISRFMPPKKKRGEIKHSSEIVKDITS
ncbi:MAG: furin-like repeat-containing protein, partial [archaeon]|nr:furin-like repeat-containing protein [archaeon]